MSACICKTERDPFKPCPLPEAEHAAPGIEVLEGPDGLGRYRYVRHWFDQGTGRERGQVFFGALPQVAA